MSLYKQFETDTSVEREGLWLEYGTNSKGEAIRIRIARAGGSNDRYLKLLEARFKPHRRILQVDALEHRTLIEKISREVYAETVLLAWEGVEDRDGNVISFSKDAAVKLMCDLPDLYSDIVQQSTNASLFRKSIREADAKN
jgi:hypothetical protein